MGTSSHAPSAVEDVVTVVWLGQPAVMSLAGRAEGPDIELVFHWDF